MKSLISKRSRCYLCVSKNRGAPKWMVYKGKHRENPIRIDDLGGNPPFLETPTSVRSRFDHFGLRVVWEHFARGIES